MVLMMHHTLTRKSAAWKKLPVEDNKIKIVGKRPAINRIFHQLADK